ncbi:glycosyltransferase family 2 protein [Bacillus sp. CMF12]|uniref:glycosyltransferase family 2 protein n=1 Tax=Bacillaceae TaxID=186817 RepID=UPI001FB400B1|nr:MULTISPECIES: glycosyltransferase family A protein [Bacillaceae]UOE55079.1 glycosyltransferase family 2 protein [Cytobacillus oceanisediminis]USK49537.1 glycosyltransferase family 2 protein [Bacillus sp. CMF12]
MVSIICCTMRQDYMENVFENYENQVWKEKELIIILNNDEMDKAAWQKRAKESHNVTVFQLREEVTLGECLNIAILNSRYNIIAKFDDDDFYAPNYLAQSVRTLKKTKADIVGKRTVYMYFQKEKLLAIQKPGKENRFVKHGIKGATLVFRKEIMDHVRFPKVNLGEDTYFLKLCNKSKLKIYSGDKNNYACLRISQPGHHTWTADNDRLIRKSVPVSRTSDFNKVKQIVSDGGKAYK